MFIDPYINLNYWADLNMQHNQGLDVLKLELFLLG